MHMTGDRVRRHVIVSGRVQGVAFRYYARERAQSRGVAGWIRNRPDGTVEAVVEGEPDAVASVLRFLGEGPRHARVDDVEVRDEPPEGLDEFVVR